jgi:hypothetical protein
MYWAGPRREANGGADEGTPSIDEDPTYYEGLTKPLHTAQADFRYRFEKHGLMGRVFYF